MKNVVDETSMSYPYFGFRKKHLIVSEKLKVCISFSSRILVRIV